MKLSFHPAALRPLPAVVRVFAAGAGLLLAQLPAHPARVEEESAAEALTILDTQSYWRFHMTWQTEQVQRDSGGVELMSLPVNRATEMLASDPPPENWMRPDFDDFSWARLRGPVKVSWNSGEMSLLCLRGKFDVRDPAASKGLTLSLSFIGGAAVYVNGKELVRQGLPDGKLTPPTPAAALPEEAYVDPEGHLYLNAFGDPDRYGERLKSRVREVAAVHIPAAMLKKGVNVLGIEIHRALASEIYLTGRTRNGRGIPGNHWWWSRLGFQELKLTSPGASDNVAPNVARPTVPQIWNHPVAQRLYASDYGDPNEGLRPVRLAGVPNAVLSGQVVVGEPGPIRDLRIVPGDLIHSDGRSRIPASAVEVNYLQMDGPPSVYRQPPCFESVAAEVPETVSPAPRENGAMQPVWIRVRVPHDAIPGGYSGKIAIATAAGGKREIPLELALYGWPMPDARDFTAHVGLVESPDSVAIYYGVAMWSDAHWRLLGRTFELLGEVGNKTLYIPVIRRTNFGNEHGMVRWIRKAGGVFDYDFSIVEKYLDVALAHLGKPPVICFYIWDRSMGGLWKGQAPRGREASPLSYTLLDPATGALTGAEGPLWGAPEMREFLAPVLLGLRAILERRGLEKSMMLGLAGDMTPSKAGLDIVKSIVPDARWVIHSHPFPKIPMQGAPVGYVAHVWGVQPAPDPAAESLTLPDFTGLLRYKAKRLYGWRQNEFIWATFPRNESDAVGAITTTTHPAVYMVSLEGILAAGLNGFGRVGADFWDIPKLGQSRNRSILDRYPENDWGTATMALTSGWVLAPGKDGPLPTQRFELLRIAQQTAEARIYIEKTLTDPLKRSAIGEDLAGRCQTLLDKRLRAILYGRKGNWDCFLSTGWEARDEQLFALAAEVAANLKSQTQNQHGRREEHE